VRQASAALFVKSAFDCAAAGCGLLLIAPVLAAAALAIRASIGSPVLVRQPRTGRGGAPFTVVNFRTMRDARGPDGSPLPDAVRLTRLGALLRSASLDELPLLWNVVRGELGLAGPRPLLMGYLPRYSPEPARLHDVLPGITGWAQINGRNAISWEQKLALDVWYVDHWPPWLDLRVLLTTAARMLQRHGIASAGHATMPPFTGSADGVGARPGPQPGRAP
jgi:lipopolysaccharide/colanic/teichoic acid biosynthesis glycosyltransferase